MSYYNYINFFKTTFSIFIPLLLYNISLTLNNYIVPYFPQQLYINNVYNFLFNFLYKTPAYILLLFYISKKVPYIFQSLGYKFSDLPNHPYIVLLFNVSYLLLAFHYLFIGNTYALFINNTLFYSIYLSQLIYLFLDPNLYFFKNNIDFYNSNALILNIVGGIYSILDITLFKRFRLIWFVLYTAISVPVCLKVRYITHKSYINVFYIPQRVLSNLISVCRYITSPPN